MKRLLTIIGLVASITLVVVLLWLFFDNYSHQSTANVPEYAENSVGSMDNQLADQIVDQVNQARQENGLSALKRNDLLDKAAGQKAMDMLTRNYWSHNTPDGKLPFVFITKTGYDYVYAGEVLACDFQDVSGVVNGWLNSKIHREVILSSDYKDVGIAAIKGKLLGKQTTLIVMFTAAAHK